MRWNWELPDWPQFSYNRKLILQKEKVFLLEAGTACAFLKNIKIEDYQQFAVEILSFERLESSRIEGAILNRMSLQSSIRKNFGLQKLNASGLKESQMTELLYDVYITFEKPLTHKMLYSWHRKLFPMRGSMKYRTHKEPMQIVSYRYDSRKVFFEAPPSKTVQKEMTDFIYWFNASRNSSFILERAAVAHLYFESIHPFKDGNGRLGRLLIEKILSQGVERPILIAVSKILEKRKKEYYAALERCNHTLKIDHWIDFFTDVILQAQDESMQLLKFLIQKTNLFDMLANQLNPRQEKVLKRMFKEGIVGFKVGLNAEKYIAITKTSKATATRDLNDLVEKKALKKTGELRHTRYWLNIL